MPDQGGQEPVILLEQGLHVSKLAKSRSNVTDLDLDTASGINVEAPVEHAKTVFGNLSGFAKGACDVFCGGAPAVLKFLRRLICLTSCCGAAWWCIMLFAQSAMQETYATFAAVEEKFGKYFGYLARCEGNFGI